MNTFLYFLKNLKSIPMVTSWKLEELAQMKGHQELYTKQSPSTASSSMLTVCSTPAVVWLPFGNE